MTPTPEAQPSALREALEKVHKYILYNAPPSIEAQQIMAMMEAALSAPEATGEWRSLETDPPKGDGEVVLFPTISDVGILYTASNPAYARVNALKNGYTHWFRIPPHPQEAEMKARCAAIEPYDGSPLPEPPPSAREAALEAALREARELLLPIVTYESIARIDALLAGEAMRPVKTLAREVEARVEALLLERDQLREALREARRYLIIPEGPHGTMQELVARIDALLAGSQPWKSS